MVCVTASAPGAIYSAVKAVPKFLKVSRWWQWILSWSVSLSTALLTSFGLPRLASLVCKASNHDFDSTELALIGKALASIAVPCIVTVVCEVEL
eukprot:2268264-Amphidinium_carterae.1